MYTLKQSLLACGYTGPCENINLLKWALRTGACSPFFLDLILWLEEQLQSVVAVQQVRDNIQRLFGMMRHSILMKPSYGSELSINPKEFRLQTLKVLVRQLQLRRPPPPQPVNKLNLEDVQLQKDIENKQDLKKLTIKLDLNRISQTGDWNQRLVFYNRNIF